MAETVSDINGGGNDYATWAAWASDKAGDIRAGNAEAAEGYGDVTTVGAHACQLVGFLTDPDSYLALRVADSVKRTSAVPLRSGQTITVTSNRTNGFRNAIRVESGAEFTRISGLDLVTDSDSNADAPIRITLGASVEVADIRIWGCTCTHVGAVDGIGIAVTETSDVTAHIIDIWNCLIYNYTAGMNSSNAGSDHIVTLYNCTFFGGSADGVDRDAGTVNAYNVISYNNTGSDFAGTVGGDYNMSEDATAPGANSLDSGTGGNDPDFVNVGAGTEDFHLQATSDAIDSAQGDADGGGEPSATFADDIDGITRGPADADWEMGASEFVAAPDAFIPQVIMI